MFVVAKHRRRALGNPAGNYVSQHILDRYSTLAGAFPQIQNLLKTLTVYAQSYNDANLAKPNAVDVYDQNVLVVEPPFTEFFVCLLVYLDTLPADTYGSSPVIVACQQSCTASSARLLLSERCF